MRNFIKRVGYFLVRMADTWKPSTVLDLRGDRDIEWSWIAANLPESPGKVLDVGHGDSSLSLIAALKGAEVTAFDLSEANFPYQHPSLNPLVGDILHYDFAGSRFDTILNCSTVEHIGLPGRYSDLQLADGDLQAMGRLRELLKGVLILTIPVGLDGVFPPYHRVYGTERLPQLLKGYQIVRQEFWTKRAGHNLWVQVDRAEALSTPSSSSFYALGLFVLKAG